MSGNWREKIFSKRILCPIVPMLPISESMKQQCDWFQWNMTVAFVIIIVELVIGTLPKEPMVRVLAMPLPSLLAFFGLELSLLELMYVFHLHAPFRISSVARGENLRPAIYPLIEDIIAVDGDGGTAYRMRLNQRYEASPYFRLMLHRLSMFWALPALLMAVGTTYMIFSVRRDTAYVVSGLHLF